MHDRWPNTLSLQLQLGLGAKAVLIAGAIDSNIDAIVANNSGTGGSENLAKLAEQFPHWLSPDVANTKVQADLIEHDAPSQWIRVFAPCGLFVLQASDDAWRDHPERLVLQQRTSGDAMTTLDWQRAAKFVRGAVA